MSVKEKKYLSASRIDLLNQCSWKYWARYHLKVPNQTNSGASKGSIVHFILEYIFKPKHKKYFDYLMKNKTYLGNKVLERVINYHAKKLDVYNKTDLEMIDRFIQCAINNDFFGPKDTIERHGEREFKIEVDEKGKKYKIYGFIDQTFIHGKKDNLMVLIRDFKSSKRFGFGEDKNSFNIQSLVYQLAIRHLHKEISNRNLEFLFLAFEDDPILKSKSEPKSILDGLEFYLTSIQEIVDNFDEKLAESNYAAAKGWPTPEQGFSGLLCCGKSGLKKDGTKKFICEYREPFTFYLLMEGDKIIQTALEKKDLTIKVGQSIVERYYAGCKYFYPQNYQDKSISCEPPASFNESDIFAPEEISD